MKRYFIYILLTIFISLFDLLIAEECVGSDYEIDEVEIVQPRNRIVRHRHLPWCRYYYERYKDRDRDQNASWPTKQEDPFLDFFRR